MNSFFYPKLAFSNIKKNRKTYIPYAFTCIITIMMYYIITELARNKGLDKMPGAGSLKPIMIMSMVVVAIFSVIFLFYTNSFLIKQRKKEIGLYNVLGMGKRHIAKMMVWETLIITIVSLGVGLLGGFLFGKLMYLILLKLLHFTVELQFAITVRAIVETIALFAIIFFATLLFNLFQIRIANPIELLRGGQQGEKEPKTKWILTLFGLVTVGIGYYIAIATDSPLEAVFLFFVAVILVIIGTYALFIAGSITLLKLLRKNKNFYYKTSHFTAVSGMIYRMKQNAVGLANICILSTIVLVMISTSLSLYLGMDDAIENRYPREFNVILYDGNGSNIDKINQIVQEETKAGNSKVKNEISYRYAEVGGNQTKNKFALSNSINYYDQRATDITLLLEQDYNTMEKDDVKLSADEVIVYTTKAKSFGYDSILIGDKRFRVVKELKNMKVEKKNRTNIAEEIYVILSDEAVLKSVAKQVPDKTGKSELLYRYTFDVDGDKTDVRSTLQVITQRTMNEIPKSFMENKTTHREDSGTMYGGLLFIGIFLGGLFLMATVLIIYYKQITEGIDDKQRFEIMQKVGMSKKEVRHTIKSQVLTVFFLPLVAAVIHIAVAFRVITLLLRVLDLVNIPLFLTCTIVAVVVFAIFYAIVFILTAKEYYKIVK